MRCLRQTTAAAVAMIGLLMMVAPAIGRDVIFVPTPEKVVHRMLELTEVGPGDTVIDLGSGDGRIAIAAVKDFGADRAIGIDIDPQRIAESRENAREAGVEDRVTFRQEDLFETDISEATVVTMYLLSSINERLKPKLLSELRPGTRIASHDFGMENWQPDHKEVLDGSTIYVWTLPARIDGEWQVRIETPDGSNNYLVEMDQEFRTANGMARNGQDSFPLHDGQVDADQLSFIIENADGVMHFSGQIEGSRMTGTVDGPDGQPLTWQAERVD